MSADHAVVVPLGESFGEDELLVPSARSGAWSGGDENHLADVLGAPRRKDKMKAVICDRRMISKGVLILLIMAALGHYIVLLTGYLSGTQRDFSHSSADLSGTQRDFSHSSWSHDHTLMHHWGNVYGSAEASAKAATGDLWFETVGEAWDGFTKNEIVPTSKEIVRMSGNETMIVFMDTYQWSGFVEPYEVVHGEVLRRLRPHGIRAAFIPSGTIHNYPEYSNNRASAVTGCSIASAPSREEVIRFEAHVKSSTPASAIDLCKIDFIRTSEHPYRINTTALELTHPDCFMHGSGLGLLKAWNLTHMFGYKTERNSVYNYSVEMKNERCGLSDDNACIPPSDVPPQCIKQCGSNTTVRAISQDGLKCWCHTNVAGGVFRQSEWIDRAADLSKDIYTESFMEAECWAKKNGVKNIIMAGGDALQCLLTREGGLYYWLNAGYKTYVMADLLTNINGKMLKSYAYGVYAGLGAKVIAMNASL